MNTKTLFQIAGLLAISATAGHASVINFDSLPVGTIVTNQFASEGAVFSEFFGGISGINPALLGSVVGPTSSVPALIPFGNSSPNAMYLSLDSDEVFLNFVTASGDPGAVPSVSFRLGNGNNFFETETVDFFGPGGFITGFSVTTGGVALPNNGQTVTLSPPGGICQVQFIGGGTFGAGMFLDDVTFDTATARCEVSTSPMPGPGPTVPEPGTLVLLGIALVGVGFSRRRKLN